MKINNSIPTLRQANKSKINWYGYINIALTIGFIWLMGEALKQ